MVFQLDLHHHVWRLPRSCHVPAIVLLLAIPRKQNHGRRAHGPSHAHRIRYAGAGGLVWRSRRWHHYPVSRVSHHHCRAIWLDDEPTSCPDHTAFHALLRRAGSWEWSDVPTRATALAADNGCCRRHDWRDWSAWWVDLAQPARSLQAVHLVVSSWFHRLRHTRDCHSRYVAYCFEELGDHLGRARRAGPGAKYFVGLDGGRLGRTREGQLVVPALKRLIKVNS